MVMLKLHTQKVPEEKYKNVSKLQVLFQFSYEVQTNPAALIIYLQLRLASDLVNEFPQDVCLAGELVKLSRSKATLLENVVQTS